MKKKFINGLLLIALIVGFTSSMVSCRDYDDEKIGNLEGIINYNDAHLRELLDEQGRILNGKIQSLEELLAECQTNCRNFRDSINRALNLYLTIENFNTFKDELGNIYYTKEQVDSINRNYYTKSEIDNFFTNYYTKAEVDTLLAHLERDLKQYVDGKTNLDAIVSLIQNGKESLQSVFNEYIQNYVINNSSYITNVLNGISKDSVIIIADSIANSYPHLTQEQVGQMIADSIAKLNLGLTQEQVQSLLSDSLSKYATQEWVKQLVSDSIAGLASEDFVKKIVSDSLTKAIITINNTISLVQNEVQAAKDLATANSLRIDSVAQALGTINGNINNLTTRVGNLETNLQNLADSLDRAVINLNTKITAAQDSANKALATAYANTALINALQENYDALEARVDSLEERMGNAEDRLDGIDDSIDEINQMLDNLGLRLNGIDQRLDGVDDRLDNVESDVVTLRTMIDDANDLIDALKDQVAADELAAKALHDQMLETISGLANEIDGIIDNLGDLRDAFDSYYTKPEVDQMISDLQQSISDLQDSIDEVAETLNEKLNAHYKAFENVMAKFITGIALNGTDNPMFGSFSLPVGIRSNVLVAFHGKLDQDLEFPTRYAASYALPNSKQWEVITDEDLEMLDAPNGVRSLDGYMYIRGNQNIVAGQDVNGNVSEGNAGTLYLTVNPTDRDFTGTQFSVINSQNKESIVELSDLAKSDHVLTWGYTRASGPAEQSANGFYEAKATISLDAVNSGADRPNVKLGDFKDVINDLRSGASDFNVTRLANTVYENVSNILEAKAVKATWEDTLGVHSVVSPYDLAVTTIQPLSFGFAKDFRLNGIPGLGRVESFIDGLLDKINFAMPEVKEFTFDMSSIQLEELTDDLIAKFVVIMDTTVFRTQIGIDINGEPVFANEGQDITVVIPASSLPTYEDGNGNIVTPSGDLTVTLHIESQKIYIRYDLRDEIQQIYGNVITSVEAFKDQIQNFLDDVNEYLAELNEAMDINSLKNDIRTTIHKYITSINKKFARFMNPNRFLQPIMLVKTATGSFARISEARRYPSKFSGDDMLIIPTTFNAEILSPAFKKFVAVTNVSKNGTSAKLGDATCRNVLRQMNAQEGLNQVIDGGVGGNISVSVERGYTYEVLYTAVDYSGLVFARKFYFTVSE